MHPRNKHLQGYDFAALTAANAALTPFVRDNGYGRLSIDFANPAAVLQLNKALLAHHYGVQHWQLPDGFLCPAVPGRVDYLHHLADLLATEAGKLVKGRKVQLLDIGTGANLIYPLLAQADYGWQVVAAELDPDAVVAASQLIKQNQLQSKISLRQQSSAQQIFKGIIGPKDLFELTLCNPPFHATEQDAKAGTERKQRQLGLSGDGLNFAGRSHELVCEGGEQAFIGQMIRESKDFASQVLWFSSLVSKVDNLPALVSQLQQAGADVKQIDMQQGQKSSRLLAWSWQNAKQRQLWCQYRLK
ncbi:23S rRNA (adenine(1618)-N(6))-methyltransferase RlmF [Rheinheimera marina]|uniref:Ribosomal RNA large subunit methyltransferase F n=1 Tax=Rheinheimera marina TaxID=1774958 RepID=A0ABV9JFK1_9GAMM